VGLNGSVNKYGGRVHQAANMLVDDTDPRVSECPDEPPVLDGGHQAPGAVRRLVIPDREASVELRQADRQMEEPGAWRLAVLEADRLARQRPDGSEAPDRQTDVATAHAATLTHGIGARSRVDPDCSSGSGRRTGHRDSCDRRARPG